MNQPISKDRYLLEPSFGLNGRLSAEEKKNTESFWN